MANNQGEDKPKRCVDPLKIFVRMCGVRERMDIEASDEANSDAMVLINSCYFTLTRSVNALQ